MGLRASQSILRLGKDYYFPAAEFPWLLYYVPISPSGAVTVNNSFTEWQFKGSQFLAGLCDEGDYYFYRSKYQLGTSPFFSAIRMRGLRLEIGERTNTFHSEK